MATERELKTAQEAVLFDVIRLINTKDEAKRNEILDFMFARAQSGMTKEEIAEVVKRAMEMINKYKH